MFLQQQQAYKIYGVPPEHSQIEAILQEIQTIVHVQTDLPPSLFG